MGMRASHQGGSVQYEDTVGVDGDSGVSILAFRNDAEAQLATADLSHVRVSADLNGRLNANANMQVGDVDVDAGNAVPVDVLSIIPGVGATNLGKAEDAAHASGDVGVMALAIRSDTPAATGADGDYEPLQTVGGRLHITQSDVQKDDTDKLAVSVYFEGAGAPGDTSVSATAPLPVTTAAAAGVTYVDAAAANVHEPAINTAAVVTYAAGGGSVRHYISGVAWSYDGAPTAGVLTITDGGATVFTTDVTAGGPGFQDFAPPLRFAANSAVVVTLAAAVVTGIVSVKGHWSA